MSKKVSCLICIGRGIVRDTGAWNESTSCTCSICKGTGYAPVDRLKISMDEYKQKYNEAIKDKVYSKPFEIIE